MQATRESILTILKEQGQATVRDLSQTLGLTPVTVRHHLDILRGEGLVGAPVARRRKTPGRPQYVYRLTDEASSFFPKRYGQLAGMILEELRDCLSESEVNRILRHVGERIASRADLPTENGFEARLNAAVDFLDRLGYMAQQEKKGDGYLIHIANCPYEQVANQDPAICALDLSLLTHLLGTPPRRIAWAAAGDRQCTYAVQAPAD